MSNPLSQITIIGRLMSEPNVETKFSNRTQKEYTSGYCQVSVQRSKGDKTEDQNSDVFYCELFGGTASNIQKYFHKGDFIILTGTILTYKRNGEQYASGWKLKVDTFGFVPSKKEENSNGNNSGYNNNNGGNNNGYNNNNGGYNNNNNGGYNNNNNNNGGYNNNNGYGQANNFPTQDFQTSFENPSSNTFDAGVFGGPDFSATIAISDDDMPF